jgi:sugar phosphate isomerase/epimerase
VWDSHHTHRTGETPEEVWGNLGPRIKLVQVKDAVRDPSGPGGWKLVLLGRGEVPVKGMVEVLARGGYDGWVSVEWEKLWHPEIEEPEVALPQHLDQLAQWLAQQTGKFSSAEGAG